MKTLKLEKDYNGYVPAKAYDKIQLPGGMIISVQDIYDSLPKQENSVCKMGLFYSDNVLSITGVYEPVGDNKLDFTIYRTKIRDIEIKEEIKENSLDEEEEVL